MAKKLNFEEVENASVSYDYITTRWYRAPEILKGKPYWVGIDLWALGCTMAEMCLDGKILLQGRSTAHQLELVDQFEQNSIKPLISIADSFAVDLLLQLLEVDPQNRITARCALKHAYFQ